MEWRPDPERDGLGLERPPSTLEGVRFRDARRRFIASRGGDATTRMANGPTAGVLRRFLHRETVEQCSKWRTEWHGERGKRTFAGSVPAAARLSDVLFGR